MNSDSTTSKSLPRLWVIEDHAALRESLREILESTPADVATFSSCEAALEHRSDGAPAAIILDIGLPGMSGLEGISHLKARYPETEILMFTVFDDRERIFAAVCAGASGYLLKSEPLERISSAVVEVLGGGSPMTPEIARLVLERFSQLGASSLAPVSADEEEVALSDREREVLRGLVDGLAKKEIADRLSLSIHTVDNYVRRIYRKLHVNTLGGAVAKALKQGLV